MDDCAFCEHREDCKKGLYMVNPCEKIETHYNPYLPKPKKRIFTITEPKKGPYAGQCVVTGKNYHNIFSTRAIAQEYMHYRFPYDIIRNR